MKTLTKSQQAKILKAHELIAKAQVLIDEVVAYNNEFKCEGNTNSLTYYINHAEMTLADHKKGILYGY